MEDKLKEIEEYVRLIWNRGYIPVGVYADFMNILGIDVSQETTLRDLIDGFRDYNFIDRKTKKACIAEVNYCFEDPCLIIIKPGGDTKHNIWNIEDLDKLGVDYVKDGEE